MENAFLYMLRVRVNFAIRKKLLLLMKGIEHATPKYATLASGLF